MENIDVGFKFQVEWVVEILQPTHEKNGSTFPLQFHDFLHDISIRLLFYSPIIVLSNMHIYIYIYINPVETLLNSIKILFKIPVHHH